MSGPDRDGGLGGAVRIVPYGARDLLAMEDHETRCHAAPARLVQDLGDALLLTDPADPDPFWNRLSRIRWPAEPAAFDARLADALARFAVLGRRPHAWPAPGLPEPPDLAARLVANGFRDIGGGHLMVLVDRAACAPVRPDESGPGITLRAVRGGAPGFTREAVESTAAAAAAVLLAAFAADRGQGTAPLTAELVAALADPRTALAVVAVDGVAAAAARTTRFAGHVYISSVGTHPDRRGRGLAAIAVRHAVAAAGAEPGEVVYLGVHAVNATAIRLYERLGFASVGASPDLLMP